MRRDDERRLLLSARIAFAAVLALLLVALLLVLALGVRAGDGEGLDGVVVLAVVPALIGAILMLLGIEVPWWRRDGK